jgi:Flp pilus assembly protein TadD
LAASYINGGDLLEARKAIEKALQLAPNEISVRAMQGRLLIMEGNIQGAIAVYRDILSKETNISARETVGVLELVAGNVDIAIDELLKALEDDQQKRASILYNLGIAHLVKTKYGRAISYFRKALQRDLNYSVSYTGIGVAYLLLGYMKKSELMFRIASERGINDSEAKLNLSRILVLQKKWNDAASVLNDLVQRFPNNWRAREDLGIAYLQLGRHPEAANQFYRVLNAIKSGVFKGNLSNALNNIGVTSLFTNNYEKAEAMFQASISESDRKNLIALTNLARLYLRTHKIAKAEPLLDELKRVAGGWEVVAMLLASCDYLKQDYSKAIDEANHIIANVTPGSKLSTEQVNAASLITGILDDVFDDYSSAEKILRNVYSANKDSAVILNNLAYTLILQGKTKEASMFLDKIDQSKDISYVISIATRGLLHIKIGEMAKGAALYNQAASMVADEEIKAQILQKKELELGRWYRNRGETAQARIHLERAISFNVKDEIFKKKATELLAS